MKLIKNNREVKAGVLFDFGNYYIAQKEKKSPLKWVVADVRDQKVLALTKDAIDIREYSQYIPGTKSAPEWEFCDLRKWLNDEFYNEAFSDEEKAQIHRYTETDDSVFCLSKKEIDKLPDKDVLHAKPSKYTLLKNKEYGYAGVKADEYMMWWTRSAMENGGVFYYPRDTRIYHAEGGVRPALLIDKNVVLKHIEKTVNIYETGDFVEFGYDTKNSSPIRWKILELKGKKAILISDKVLERMIFTKGEMGINCYGMETYRPWSWDESAIRKWLNDEFYNEAFSDEEKRQILKTKMKADTFNAHKTYFDDFPDFHLNDVEDFVFLPSWRDLSTLFLNNSQRIAYGTDYCIKTYGDSADGKMDWWTRNCGEHCIIVDVDGRNNYYSKEIGPAPDSVHGVRPMIVIKL